MFIVIDGPDGAGKSTLAKMLTEKLAEADRVLLTAEPTKTELGKKIRQILANGTEEEKSTLTELFVKDRGEHINDFIIPNVNDGYVVISDRYRYSTVCYQHLQGEETQKLVNLNKDFISPDITFIVTTDDVNVLLDRIANRGADRDFFETKTNLTIAIEEYSKMKEYFPQDNIVYIDCANTPEESLRIMVDVINEYKAGELNE